MKNMKAMMSSDRPDWPTPWDLFNRLDEVFHFDLDVCATAENTKCKAFYSPEMDGLKQDWPRDKMMWCNPPYGREIVKWMDKIAESKCSVVSLVPARTDAKWFQSMLCNNHFVLWVAGRVRFEGATSSAPFPSAIFIKIQNCKTVLDAWMDLKKIGFVQDLW